MMPCALESGMRSRGRDTVVRRRIAGTFLQPRGAGPAQTRRFPNGPVFSGEQLLYGAFREPI